MNRPILLAAAIAAIALIGAGSARGLTASLRDGFPVAMWVMAGLCAAAALLTVTFVSRDRTPHRLVTSRNARLGSGA